MKFQLVVIGLSALALATPVSAQGTASPPLADAKAANPPPPPQSGSQNQVVIPALTPVKLVLKQHLGSKLSIGGELFDFQLAEPLMIDGAEVVPAGTPGRGEVIHAKKGGGSGSSGELVLAARYLQVGDRQLRLRSLQTIQSAKDNIGTVNALAPVPVVGLFGYMVKGKEVDLPEGTLVSAKTAEPFTIEPSPPKTSEVSGQPPAEAAAPPATIPNP